MASLEDAVSLKLILSKYDFVKAEGDKESFKIISEIRSRAVEMRCRAVEIRCRAAEMRWLAVEMRHSAAEMKLSAAELRSMGIGSSDDYLG